MQILHLETGTVKNKTTEIALQKHIQNPVEHLRLNFFAKIVNS